MVGVAEVGSCRRHTIVSCRNVRTGLKVFNYVTCLPSDRPVNIADGEGLKEFLRLSYPPPYLIVLNIMSTDSKIDDLHHQLFEEGLKVRRAVLGHEYVDRALQNASSFSRPGQQLITEWAWGNIWRRPGLDRKQRSLLSK